MIRKGGYIITKYRPNSLQLLFTVSRNMSQSIQPTVERQEELSQNYQSVLQHVNSLTQEYNVKTPVTLVAVSKLKPSSDIQALYNAGVRHFGENYVQELISKSKELPQDIKWHFIGGLQSGKAKDLAKGVKSLYAVETIDALKKVKQLDRVRGEINGLPINVYLQINTSEEDQKSGFSISDLNELYETLEFIISDECKNVNLIGLMTIGSFAQSTAEGEDNQDFKKLVELKQNLDKKYAINLGLSMGMSSDYAQAIKQGSTNVRVGTSIFGARPPRNTT
ncbi:uncharacterized protein RJT21DRAFT_120503 [Scheffersomyces amazonensis]|uniref:uncharacterized protein n=1 Tax=Scheffersomyces amazonensis TaxID=1078765 RepID=UPI00315C9D09